MAITYKYEKPQVKVYQNFTEVNTAMVGTQPAFVFGPAYQLFRYNNEDEHDFCLLVNEDGVAETYDTMTAITDHAYPQNIKGVDEDWYKPEIGGGRMLVYLEDAYLQVGTAEIALLDASKITLPTGYYVDKFATYIGIKKDPTTLAAPVRAGDFVINENYQVEVVFTNPQYAGDVSGTSGTSDDDPIKACYYIAKIDAVFNDDDLSIDDPISEKRVLNHFDSIAVPHTVSGKDIYDTVIVAPNWTTTANTITINAGMNVDVSRRMTGFPARVIKAARIYVQFRKLDTTSASVIDHIIDVSEITGQIDPANPLWYGVYLAKINSGECPVYYMSTQGVELERYIEVLKKATLTDDIYILCPVTDNKEVINAVEGHVDEMSGPETKRWRIAFIAPPVEEESIPDNLKNRLLKITSTENLTASFVKNSGGAPDDEISAKTMLAPNDTITFSIDGKQPTAQVDRIVNDQVIVLRSIPEGASQGDVVPVVQIEHVYTSTELADQIASLARHYADRRMYAVFPDTIRQLIDGETLDVPGYFAAAAVAGLCSSTLPQQPLTNMPINGIDDVPVVYEKFDTLELNAMAAGGAFIIAQDLPNDVVYVRHQLSTATYQGNLLTRELSITKNVDSISYYLAETCDDLIGKYNITPELIDVVHNRLLGAIRYLENSQGSLYGPQLLEENTEIISVAVHPTLADHIEAYIRINPPKPFNVLDIRLTVV